MHQAWEFGKEGPVYEFEFYDGTPLDLEETGSYLEPRKVLLRPKKRHTDKEILANMKEIWRGWIAGEYPKWIMITATYRDQIGQEWIRGYQEVKNPATGEEPVTDYIFNTNYWSWS